MDAAPYRRAFGEGILELIKRGLVVASLVEPGTQKTLIRLPLRSAAEMLANESAWDTVTFEGRPAWFYIEATKWGWDVWSDGPPEGYEPPDAVLD